MRTLLILSFFIAALVAQRIPGPGGAAASGLSGYSASATVSFAAATGSTQTNITLAFTASDNKLKTVGNGGVIQNTVTRVGVTVPADLIITNDATCASLTGSYKWGIETYSASAGTLVGWILIPSLTSGAAVVPTVCIGNIAVNTYQGGAAGAEYDGNTLGAYHLPDGTTLTATNFSSGGLANGTLVNTPTAAVGKIDGGGGFVLGSSQRITFGTPSIAGDITASVWVKTSSSSGVQALWSQWGSTGSVENFLIYNNAGKAAFFSNASSSTGFDTITISDGAWHYLTLTCNTTGASMVGYVDGVSRGSAGFVGPLIARPTANLVLGCDSNFAFCATATIDDARIASVARSANWIATEYANQNSPPAIAAF